MSHRVITGRRYKGRGTREQNREKRTMDGIVFDSLIELAHYANVLKPLHHGAAIRALQYHPKFVFRLQSQVTGEEEEVGSYEADFSFIEAKTDKLCVHDVKAWERDSKGQLRFITDREYLMKKRLMKVCFGIDVEEV
jgi:hypothetical protein